MRGLLIALQLILVFVFINAGIAMSPIEVPVQYGQFCDVQKVSGKGVTNMSTSIEDDDLSHIHILYLP